VRCPLSDRKVRRYSKQVGIAYRSMWYRGGNGIHLSPCVRADGLGHDLIIREAKTLRPLEVWSNSREGNFVQQPECLWEAKG
jgi:hypothetical protein